ncbi:MAG: c-type cytochrome [Thiotrichales bacterium]|nr:MAG: c-type cytochrome [Thiotrichales bacterium]
MVKIMDKGKYRLMTATLLLVCCLSNTAQARDFVDLVKYCEECHGMDGVSTIPDVPIIAGFSEEGFLNTIDVFRENERIAMEFHKPGEPETVMNEIAQSLSDDEVEELAKYYSGLKFKPAKQSADPEKASRGAILHKKSCEKCHTNNGKDPVEDAAILAGQWMPYLERQFDNILSKKRLVPKSMYRRVKKLSPQDIEALLHFYALEGNK